jgi:stress response protein YsnF
MPLFKIGDFNPNYREQAFDGEDVKGLDVYAGITSEKIGTIHDVLVDETGRFRYFVIDTGFWIFGKRVLLPVGRCRVDADARRIYAIGISSIEQAEKLPEYDDRMTVDYDYEERVRHIYRTPTVATSVPVNASGVSGVASQAPIPSPISNQPRPATYDRNSYTYEQEPSLYQMNEQEHQKLRLYEERLVANKSSRQTGEVAIGKRVETETARVSVPVEKERVVIERRTPQNIGTTVTPSDVDFSKAK